MGTDRYPPALFRLTPSCGGSYSRLVSGHKSDPAGWNDSRHRLGALGEELARRFLESRGWRIRAQRFRLGHAEIDFVIQQLDTVAFVEVKTRRTLRFGLPEEALTWKKRREIARVAAAWIRDNGKPEFRYRFDFLGVLYAPGRVRVRHVENAFDLRG